jgi:hypothetical protein
MSKNNLIRQLLSVLQDMVNDYGFNRCDEKRLESIGEAKKLLDRARQSISDSVVDSALAAIISDLKAVYSEATQGKRDVDPQGHFVLDTSDVNLNEIVQVMNKCVAFSISEAESNLHFIVLAHQHFPVLIEEIERLQWFQDRLAGLEMLLDSSSETMSQMREQIEQMRPMFDDEDGAIQSVCDSHDELLSTFVDLGGIA